MEFTVENGGCLDNRVTTLEQFKAKYPPSSRAELLAAINSDRPYLLGFYMRTRVPNGQGFFWYGAEGAEWCDPSEWHQKYFDKRKAASPECYE